jgi:hypothetical protein
MDTSNLLWLSRVFAADDANNASSGESECCLEESVLALACGLSLLPLGAVATARAMLVTFFESPPPVRSDAIRAATRLRRFA